MLETEMEQIGTQVDFLEDRIRLRGRLKRSGGVMTGGRVLPWLRAHVRPRVTRQSSGDSAARLVRDEPWMRPEQDWSSTSGSVVEERRRYSR